MIVIAPSNPYVSIGPILAVDEIRGALERRHGSRASRSARSSADARSRGRPTGCSRGSRAGPHRRTSPRCYEGLIDALVIDEADAPSAPLPGAAPSSRDADDRRSAARRLARPRSTPPGRLHEGRDPRRHRQLRRRARGPARRLREDDVVDRLARRRARAARRRRARRRAQHRRANDDAVRGADLVVLAVKADAALDTARAVAGTLGRTPLLCVATAIEFRKGVGDCPIPEARSLAERVQDAARARGGRPALDRRGEPRRGAARRGCARSAATTTAKELALELAGRLVAGRALDAGRWPSARALEGLTAVIVNLNRRYKAHAGIRVTGV